jgi:hypothetical protein
MRSMTLSRFSRGKPSLTKKGTRNSGETPTCTRTDRSVFLELLLGSCGEFRFEIFNPAKHGQPERPGLCYAGNCCVTPIPFSLPPRGTTILSPS